MKKNRNIFLVFFGSFINKLSFFMKVPNYIIYITFIVLFVSCKNKNVYSDDYKTLILFKCNMTNLAFLNKINNTGLTKKIDCLCYLDKVQKEFTQEEYIQISMDPTSFGREKMNSLLKDCQ